MADLGDVVAYLCEHYPHKDELSRARLTKLVYLADWKSALEREEQLTDIEWVFNHYGPYVDDVAEAARNDPTFEVKETRNIYGDPKDLIELSGSRGYPSLTDEDKQILDSVIESVQKKNWNEFIRLVYSTYPIMTQDRFSKLNLVELAQGYTRDQSTLQANR